MPLHYCLDLRYCPIHCRERADNTPRAVPSDRPDRHNRPTQPYLHQLETVTHNRSIHLLPILTIPIHPTIHRTDRDRDRYSHEPDQSILSSFLLVRSPRARLAPPAAKVNRLRNNIVGTGDHQSCLQYGCWHSPSVKQCSQKPRAVTVTMVNRTGHRHALCGASASRRALHLVALLGRCHLLRSSVAALALFPSSSGCCPIGHASAGLWQHRSWFRGAAGRASAGPVCSRNYLPPRARRSALPPRSFLCHLTGGGYPDLPITKQVSSSEVY